MSALLVVMTLLSDRAPASVRNLECITVSGSPYVRLSDWGQSAGCAMKWNKKDGLAELSCSSAHLLFTADSRRAEISGVPVWLSLPVVNRNGTPLISLTDLQTAIEPVLSPRKSSARLETVCLDPGHGGKDTGKADGRQFEKKYTLLLANETAALLRERGLKVVLTRTTDATVELAERPLLASRQGADLFVSLHYNAAEMPVHGVEVFCLAPAGMSSSDAGGGKSSQAAEPGNAQNERNFLLAYELQKSIGRSLPLENLGVKRSHFEVLRLARIPAVLVEGGFMSNPSDARNIYDSAFRKRMARAIVDGILAYQNAILVNQ
jgi:N-acetylmuramoyl-L-alanine amidase